MTELKIYYPTGLVSIINYARSSMDLVRPLVNPGLLISGVFEANSIQSLALSDIGTLEVLLTLGATGSNRSVAFLVDCWPNPTKFVGIALDDINRPFGYLSVDGAGTVLGEGLPSGPANLQGTQLKIRLSYNLKSPIQGALTAALQVGDSVAQPWAISPGVESGLFLPMFLVVGLQAISNNLDFNGTINWVQVSGNAEVIQNTQVTPETPTIGMLDEPLDFPL